MIEINHFYKKKKRVVLFVFLSFCIGHFFCEQVSCMLISSSSKTGVPWNTEFHRFHGSLLKKPVHSVPGVLNIGNKRDYKSGRVCFWFQHCDFNLCTMEAHGLFRERRKHHTCILKSSSPDPSSWLSMSVSSTLADSTNRGLKILLGKKEKRRLVSVLNYTDFFSCLTLNMTPYLHGMC
jgi:hypothetical protein